MMMMWFIGTHSVTTTLKDFKKYKASELVALIAIWLHWYGGILRLCARQLRQDVLRDEHAVVWSALDLLDLEPFEIVPALLVGRAEVRQNGLGEVEARQKRMRVALHTLATNIALKARIQLQGQRIPGGRDSVDGQTDHVFEGQEGDFALHAIATVSRDAACAHKQPARTSGQQ